VQLDKHPEFEPIVLVPNAGTGDLQKLLKANAIRYEITPQIWWFAYRNETSGRRYFQGVFHRAKAYAEILRRNNADIVISNTLTFLEGLLAARMVGIPCILWAHGVIDSSIVGKYDPVQKICESLSLSLADHIVSCSDWTREYFLPLCGGKKIDTVHNWTEVRKLKPVKRVKRKFVSLSTLEPHKGIDTLIEAVALLRDRDVRVSLDIYGAGFSGKDLERLAGRLKVADRIRFCGRVSNVEDVYDKCAATIMPSFIEPFGMVAIEAMARKTPVIAARAGGLQEIFRDTPNLMFEPGDAEDLANRMAWVIDQPENTQRIAEAGYDRVVSAFAPERARAQFAKIIEDALTTGVDHRAVKLALDVLRVSLATPWDEDCGLGAGNEAVLRGQLDNAVAQLEAITSLNDSYLGDIAGLQRELAMANADYGRLQENAELRVKALLDLHASCLADIEALQKELASAQAERDSYLADLQASQPPVS
jgi:glycosyltransferase involved in cell wall biosynthesis